MTDFEGVTPNLDTITALPVQGLHVDLVDGKDDVVELHKRLPSDWLLSAGLINGRNVWRADLTEDAQIKDIVGKRDRGWHHPAGCCTAPSPERGTRLDAEVKSWFAFALQKCHELALLRDALKDGRTAALAEWSAPIQARRHSTRVHNPAVEKRLAAITAQDSQRANVYEVRAEAQRVLNCQRGRPPRSVPSRKPRKFVPCVWISKDPACQQLLHGHRRNISGRPLLNRNVWDWMCGYMARPSVMTWWNILASTSTGLL